MVLIGKCQEDLGLEQLEFSQKFKLGFIEQVNQINLDFKDYSVIIIYLLIILLFIYYYLYIKSI